uniref:Uncharacterized protein n=1 Tax=viral metagenome TaxID=1070528 RepID=A0A6M3IWT4_9ZZZZ
MTKGKCSHGEFELEKGCPLCVADRMAVEGNTPEMLKEAIAKVQPKNIVKVKYFSETTGELSNREYTYFSADRLNVGDIVIVPVRDTTGKAQVSAINVPESEIQAFRDKVKTIPSDSIIPEKTLDEMELEADESLAASEKQWEAEAEAELAEVEANSIEETALALRPGEDIEAHSYHEEANKLLNYAQHRVIKTLDDAKIATDDLSIISNLKKMMEAKRKEKLSPHEAQVKAIRDTYNYLMAPVLEAERITKSKQVAFLQEQERVKREQEEINRLRMEAAQKDAALHNGEISESVDLVEVIEAPERVRSDMGMSGMVDHWVYEVVDFSAVPREYLVVDSAMLNAIAKKHHDQKQIPGIKFVNKPYIATRSK